METKILMSFLFIFPACINSQITLRESGGGLKRPGDNLQLTCTVSGFSLTSNGVYWVHQPPGNGLKFLGAIWAGGSTNYNPAFQNRVTITRDTSKHQSFLQLNGLKLEDTAMYFCARDRKPYYFDYWGPGTMVTVTSASATAPSLFPLIPPLGSNSDDGQITVGCMAKDFLPGTINFSWNNPNNQTLDANVVKTFPPFLNAAGTFMASSQAAVPYSEWQAYSPFFCKADHSAGNKETRVVRQGSTFDCPDPKMIIRAPPIKAFETSSYLNSSIICRVNDLPTEKTTLQWLKEDQVLDSGFTTSKAVLQSSGGYSITSELIILKSEWITDKSFTCDVKSGKHNVSQTVNLHSYCKCHGGGEDKVKVETIPPSFADMYQTKSAKLTCRVSNIPYGTDLKPLNISWTQGSDRKPLVTTMGKPIEQENEMLYVDATATVCMDEWYNSQDTFNCKAAFPGLLPQPEEKPLKKPNGGTHYNPSVYVLPPPTEELALREKATLTCLVKGFYPNEFFVKWLRNGEPMNDADYFTSKATIESKSPEKYFAYSMLQINEQDWSAGDVYACVVGHEALPLNLTQKTVDKNTAYLDGIVDTEDDEGLENISSVLSTFIILFLVSLFYSATVTVIKVK